MKFAFFMVSLICAAALGMVSYIMATGSIPLRPPVPESTGTEAVAPTGFTMPAEEKAMIEELVQALKQERDAYARKRTELAAEHGIEEMQIKVELMQKLKADLQDVQAKLEAEIRGIQETERRNLQNIAEIYGKMEPANAANLLQQMEARRAASVLSLMTDRLAAGIMDEVAMKGEEARTKAVEWADIIRKMKSESNAPEGGGQL